MFGYVCDRFIPGGSHCETVDAPAAVREMALEHLHQHQGLECLDGEAASQVDSLIVPSQVR